MTAKKPAKTSVALPLDGAKLHAPSAERNTGPIRDLLLRHAPRRGQALEIASGTGQHVVAFARAMPGLIWQPTDITPDRLASIDAWAGESGLGNIRPAALLDAGSADWWQPWQDQSLVCLSNLLHLVPDATARHVVTGAVRALTPEGCALLYGPFRRSGRFNSAGDADFHAHITEADPRLGYKDDAQVEAWLKKAGARDVIRQEMPANNLAFIARL
jgi:hypothetical protein